MLKQGKICEVSNDGKRWHRRVFLGRLSVIYTGFKTILAATPKGILKQESGIWTAARATRWTYGRTLRKERKQTSWQK